MVQLVGFVAEAADVEARLARRSDLQPISEAEAIGLIEYVIKNPRRPVRTSQMATGFSEYTVTSDPRQSLLRRPAGQGSERGGGAKDRGKELSLAE